MHLISVFLTRRYRSCTIELSFSFNRLDLKLVGMFLVLKYFFGAVSSRTCTARREFRESYFLTRGTNLTLCLILALTGTLRVVIDARSAAAYFYIPKCNLPRQKIVQIVTVTKISARSILQRI